MTTLGIIGTGLIGGSIGMHARHRGWRVLGYDAQRSTAEGAVACGAVDEAVQRETIYTDADVIVIAAHIDGTIAELERMRFTQPRRARLVIDIASVKAPVVRAARGVRNFVATHPMAGRERSGPGAASREVFEGKTWLYVPTGDRELDWRAVEFIGSFAATPVEIEAEEHDRTVAFTSHLPQVLATLFAERLRHRRLSNVEAFMGPTAKELMRLSRSSAAMWHDILDANRVHICRELRAMAQSLNAVAEGLDRGENLYAQETSRQNA
ncbi:MAG TPA: prephenate dehydrogenase/arogenate dehydrogenase family protein [Candidatus Baltobacteraceae bacterium]|nr:prephenate dehydrogenase/arogenate dehydrogenase family protein [Candidatus Baltobacteraceae bacterium]